MISDELSYRIFKLLESNPDLTQRELAHRLGISLGKTNYCMRALVEKGWIKVSNFKNSNNKLAYVYLLTPSGLMRKMQVTRRFLQRKQAEYDQLKEEIARLEAEVGDAGK